MAQLGSGSLTLPPYGVCGGRPVEGQNLPALCGTLPTLKAIK